MIVEALSGTTGTGAAHLDIVRVLGRIVHQPRAKATGIVRANSDNVSGE